MNIKLFSISRDLSRAD